MLMNRFLSVIVITLLFTSYIKSEPTSKYKFTIDSLYKYPNYLKKYWKWSTIDKPEMADLGLDDSNWKSANPILNLHDTSNAMFNGIAWFRLHLNIDTSLQGKPLAISITHLGASEIYIDGKLINSFGTINGQDSSIYIDPREVPFIITLKDTGEHILAIRYANYNAHSNLSKFKYPKAGFELMIGAADNFIAIKNERSTIITFMLMILSGIFLALCLVHLFLYFYHRSDKSNLFFSSFMFGIALLFIIGFTCYASTSPTKVLWSILLINPTIILACISLSGFTKELFVKKYWRLLIIIAIGLLSIITSIFSTQYFPIVTITLIITVSFEAVFTIIFAMIKKVKGAKIIGSGILFFSLCILILFGLAIIGKGNFDDSTSGGQIIEILIALSVLSVPISMSLFQAWRFANINKDLEIQLQQVKQLSQKTLEQEQEKKKILESQKEKLEEEVSIRTSELRNEKKKSDDLLLNILPAEVAEQLKEKGHADAKHFNQVTVLFTDFKNFTALSEQMSAQELVDEINYCYSEFDKIITECGIEKIKTIGDAYMCAGGLPQATETNAEDTIVAAMKMLDFMSREAKIRNTQGRKFFEIRIGIHTGPVVAGIVGIKKFAYDIWGDTVNIASRMESSGESGKINMSGSTYELVKDKFTCTYRGKIEAKNKGLIDMYFIENTF